MTTCYQCGKQTANHQNPEMNDDWYCDVCFDEYNIQRFWRPNFKPDARVEVEYDFIPIMDRKRKLYTRDGIKRMCLPKTEAFQRSTQPVAQESVSDNIKQEQKGPSTLDVARMPHDKIEAFVLRNKHPHPNDSRIRLDDKNGKHDYYVVFDTSSGVEETDCIQSTSSVVAQYFPNDVYAPSKLLFGDDPEVLQHELYKAYFCESKQSLLKSFDEHVLTPLYNQNRHQYDQHAFVNSILESKMWGPNHPKHGKYFAEDKTQLSVNLQRMMCDWDEKANDASTRGTFVHYLIELDMNGQLNLMSHPLYSTLPHIQQYLHWKQTKFEPYYEPYRTEMELFDVEHRRVGTCDLLAVRKNHPPPNESNDTLHLVMFDWKNTVIDIESYYDKWTKQYRCGVGPMRNVHACSLRKYEFQQADYKTMIEKYTNLVYNGHTYARVELDMCALVCFDESNAENHEIVFELQHSYKNELAQVWQIRKLDVEKWKRERDSISMRSNTARAKLTGQQQNYLLQHLIAKNELFTRVKMQIKNTTQQQKRKQHA